MFGDISLVAAQDVLLHFARVLQKPVLEKRGYRLWHPAHVVVLAKQGDKLAGKRVDHSRIAGRDKVGHAFIAGCSQELGEPHGVQIERLHLADGIASAFVDGKAQKRTCRRDGITRCLFAEVFQGGQRMRAFLNLVEDDEGVPLIYTLPRLELEGRDESRNVVAELELLFHGRISIKVDVGDIGEMSPAEFF